jgi:hypothetical protein
MDTPSSDRSLSSSVPLASRRRESQLSYFAGINSVGLTTFRL